MFLKMIMRVKPSMVRSPVWDVSIRRQVYHESLHDFTERTEKGELLTISIDNVQGACHSANHHASDLEAEEDERHNVAELARNDVAGRQCESKQANAADDEHRDDEQDSKLGLIDTVVLPGEILDAGIGKEARYGKPAEGADKGSRVGVAGRHLAPEVGRPDEDGGDENANEDGPSNHGSLDEAAPDEGRVEDEGEWPEQQDPVAFICLGTIEQGQRFDK